jgi:FkbM family methyltransferase
MNLVITEKPVKPTICLNMIVKDEHHIIVKTLEMLCSKIDFSYWVICDTGSSDNTKELIIEFFKEKNIRGELHTHKWTNFAHNRTLALDVAFQKTDLALIFDADDEIHGTIKMPETIDADGYHLHFGSEAGTAYSRILLINNRIRWNYQSVIHEYINCLSPNPVLKHIDGNYFLVSGRSGNRSQDPQKYLKDAKVLEEAFEVAFAAKDPLHLRYAFYCANSYKDYGSHEEAIKWYKITLGLENWVQEKYMCCYNLFNCYKALLKHEESFFWAIQASKYDEERIECLFELVQHYIVNNMEKVAYNYYRIFKPFYETKYLQSKMEDKLFIENEKYNLLLPYFMILVGDKCKGEYPEAALTIAKMYEIIFTKKFPSTSLHFIGNMLYNLTLFIDLCINCIPNFILLFKDYVLFLESIKYPFEKHDGFFAKFEKYGVTLTAPIIQVIPESKFSLSQCKNSNKILFYTGFANVPWNYTYSMNNALGGSETAAAYLSKAFPSWYDIYVGGAVAEEKVDNINYINFDTMNKMLRENPFHTVIVSRYIGFYEMFPYVSFYQSFIWAHDIILYPFGSNLTDNALLNKWSSKITGCICQTEWHTTRFKELYPSLRDKMHTINNGLITDLFVKKPVKVPNRFIYTSCTERGLSKLLDLWPKILEEMPDAELVISCYNPFPQNDDEHRMNGIIQKYSSSIKHLGSLKREKLYELMATAEYWLYPSHFPETSCITSMELLMSEVVCFYYPEAGLVNTIANKGIPMVEGAELDGLFSLTNKKKSELKRLGKEYALSCSWANRALNWSSILNLEKEQVEPIEIVNNIKVINLLKREDRKQSMIKQFNNASVSPDEYEFCEAVNGQDLKESEEIRLLFENNNFGYKKGVIGCSLSHLKLWRQLANDSNNDFYVVLEDDVELLPDFKTDLKTIVDEFVKQDIEHLALALSLGNNESDINTNIIINTNTNTNTNDSCSIKIIEKDVYKLWNITFAYIISKKAAKKIIHFVNNFSIKCAIDNPQSYGEVIRYHYSKHFIVKHPPIEIVGSDITNNSNCFNFELTTKQNIKIAFCDWWDQEYCGGTFDANSNFITDILRKYGNIENVIIVSQNDNPDVLFYSIFGNAHPYLKAGRKVFFSGEPFAARPDAAFNFTFDKNSENNVRYPLWLGYINDYLLEENERRKNGITMVPKRDKFCSFISNGEVKTTHRRTFVEKLSAYKKVDCGGQFLNNIGFTVPRGVNCSGKIEHNNNYKFAIAFENEDYPGYVTEKICDIYKSNCVPIYWGTTDVVKDFNPTTFINARDFVNFDELVEYVIKVDNDDTLYASYFKEPFFSRKWLDAFNDPNKTFYKNLADCIIGKQQNLLDNYFEPKPKSVNIFNIWHNKLFDKCYDKLDTYSLNKITMFDVNQNYEKIYNSGKGYKIVKEYELAHYNSLYQVTNYCQTSCLYHVFRNALHTKEDYIGFIQYDMDLAGDFIYDIEKHIIVKNDDNSENNNIKFFYTLAVENKIDVPQICQPYDNSILEKYNIYFNTNHTHESIKSNNKSKHFICLHTFVIPTKIFIKMMTWYCTITDWLHTNYINGLYCESMSEVTEEIFGLFLLLQMIENESIELIHLKLCHEWPNLHNETAFNNYKEGKPHYSLDKIVNNLITDKNTCHSYLETYENLLKGKQISCKNVLEIGVQNRGSIKLWNDYFVNAQIYGIDIDAQPQFLKEYKRCHHLIINAYSQESINYFIDKNVKFDLIVDDGPHSLESMVYFVQHYTKLLADDGILIVEDIPDINWCNTLIANINESLKQYIEIYDLRHIKNRWDDILLVINKSSNINIIGKKKTLKVNSSCKNTAVIVEPRDIDEVIDVIFDYYKKLNDDWTFVFYCGKNLKRKWSSIFKDINIEIRELNVNNFLSEEYSDFLKSTEFWESLYGEFVLVFQLDSCIVNQEPYTIDYFMKLDKSYIGGNMYYIWDEFKRQNINIPYQSFNGGLSLRKRLDMIKVIEKYIPESTVYPSHNMQSDAEDVYFTVGCYNMGFKIGDDESSQHFSLHCIFYNQFFGCHNLVEEIEQPILNTYPNINKNKYIFKQTFNHLKKNNLNFINQKYDMECSRYSDINEHLPTLYNYAMDCESVIELGVRGCVSSWAFAKGLLNNKNPNNLKKKMFLNDIESCDINDFLCVTSELETELDIKYKWISDLELELEPEEKFDLTFIDTWHVYGQLIRELNKFSKITNKYIIMHDTTVDEYTGESTRIGLSKAQINELSLNTGFSINEIETGLWPAITDFLANNSDWVLHERFFNNNGLTILKRVMPIIPIFKIKIEYGISDCRINVTQDALDKCQYISTYIIFIPKLDYERASIFGDPIFGSKKSIFINNVEYVDDANSIYLNLVDGTVTFVIKEEEPIIVKNEKLCFDIGANVGAWSLKNIDKYDKIIAVEADENTFAKIKQNVLHNNKILPINYAACDSKEEYINFYRCDSDVLSTLNKDWLDGGKSRFNLNYTEILCKTISIDKLIKLYGMPELIKIDVEQGEYDCIKSLTQKVDTLCFEWASEFFEISLNCLNYLYKLGFRMFFVQFTDDYIFRPTEYYNIETAKQILGNTTPKHEWGMVWCK